MEQLRARLGAIEQQQSLLRMEQPLSQAVFDVWKEGDERFKQDMRDHIAAQTKVNFDYHGRIVSLETFRQNDAIKLGIFSTFVSAVFGALAAMWRN
jgi:hypothetical protein